MNVVGRRIVEALLPLPLSVSAPLSSPLSSSLSPFRRALGVRWSSKYRAAVLKEFGKPLVIEEVKRPSLKKDQVRIRVYSCGINSVDWHNVSGNLDPKPKLPFIPGFEVCGEILEVADGDKDKKEKGIILRPGERAIALHSEFTGGFAEEIVVSAKDVWVVESSMSYEIGASLTNAYATALLALTRRAEVKEGDTVLVNGAAGRVGLAAVDLAANVYRCKVIAVCGSDERASVVRDRGAFATIVMKEQDLVSEVMKITDGQGVKIIIDTVGGDMFKEVVKCAADEAKIVVAGFASKKIPQITGDELMENSFSIIGVSLDQYRKRKYDVYKQSVSDVIELSREKLIKPLKAKHFPIENVNDALKTLKDIDQVGKFVLDMP